MAESLSVDKLDADEAALLMLSPELSVQALAIVQEMDGLPLALDQAGAYIEGTGCSFSEYLALYKRRRQSLLKRESALSPDYPQTVASTWSLSFQQIEQESLDAAELLRLCAFLEPDAIPEELLTGGAAVLGPILGPVAADPFLLNEAIQELRRYSLVKRDPEAKLLNIHRLVQVVLKDSMDEKAMGGTCGTRCQCGLPRSQL